MGDKPQSQPEETALLSSDMVLRVPEGSRDAAAAELKGLGVRALRESHAATKAHLVKVKATRESKGDFPALKTVTEELERGLSVIAVEARKWKVELSPEDPAPKDHPIRPIAAAVAGHDPSGQSAKQLSEWLDAEVITPARSALDAETHEPAQVFLREIVAARDSREWPTGKDLQEFFSNTIVPLAAAAVSDLPAPQAQAPAKPAQNMAQKKATEPKNGRAAQDSQKPQTPPQSIPQTSTAPKEGGKEGKSAPVSDADLLARYQETQKQLKNTPIRPDQATVKARQTLRGSLTADAALIKSRGLTVPNPPASKARQAGQGRG